jgi:hypothetical protein
MSRRTFNVDLLHLAGPFGIWCAQRGQSRSVVLRELVSVALNGNSALKVARCPPPQFAACEPRLALVRRIGVRLDDGQLAQLRRRAADAGMSVTQYFRTLMANAESGGAPIAGMDAVHALRDSNHQLSTIARKLLSAVREHGESHRLGEAYGMETVIETIACLREHVELASTLLAEVERTRIGRRVGARPSGNARGGRQHAATGRQ